MIFFVFAFVAIAMTNAWIISQEFNRYPRPKPTPRVKRISKQEIQAIIGDRYYVEIYEWKVDACINIYPKNTTVLHTHKFYNGDFTIEVIFYGEEYAIMRSKINHIVAIAHNRMHIAPVLLPLVPFLPTDLLKELKTFL